MNVSNNKMKTSRHISDKDDDLFSYGEAEDGEDNYINKKQLIHLENDISVTIDDSIDIGEAEESISNNLSSRRRHEPNKQIPLKNNTHTNNNPHEELLRCISDTSDIFNDNYKSKAMIDNHNIYKGYESRFKPGLSVDKFEVCLPSDKIFTLQSQTISHNSFKVSNNYKEKFESLQNKYKELTNSYEGIITIVKEWQIFYIKIFNLLNMPLPTHEGNSNIFNEEYKKEILLRLEDNLEIKFNRFENLEIHQQSISIINKLKRNKFYIDNFNFSLINEKNQILININETSFSIIKNKKVPPIKIENNFNEVAPLSYSTSKKKENLSFPNLKYSNQINFEIKRIIINNPTILYTSSSYITIKSKVKSKQSNEAQTFLSNIDIDKLYALNEEYSIQLLLERKQKEEMETKQAFDQSFSQLYPEMIPPEQTFRIFLRI